jgi:hypothetical protein
LASRARSVRARWMSSPSPSLGDPRRPAPRGRVRIVAGKECPQHAALAIQTPVFPCAATARTLASIAAWSPR